MIGYRSQAKEPTEGVPDGLKGDLAFFLEPH